LGTGLRYRDRVLIGMPSPSAVEALVGLVLLILFQHGKGAGVELGILGWIQSVMPPMARQWCLWQISGSSSRRLWKNGNIVRNRVAVRQHPLRIFEV